ncbi:MAG: hypothetical protein K9N46_07660 [Candidatus Marinimicrobia bacterium]|nr:hypothetical protein [Candidatus Neomarinimicrobiota bacterium]
MIVAGCDTTTEEAVDTVREQAKKSIDKLSKKAEPLPDRLKNLTEEQVENLFAIEYKTLKISTSDVAVIDSTLAEAGRNRWDCYHVERTGDTWYLFMKRRKKSALRYLPYIESLQWFPAADTVG